jgi:hypothetical protein
MPSYRLLEPLVKRPVPITGSTGEPACDISGFGLAP